MTPFRTMSQLPRIVTLFLAFSFSPAALHCASETGKVVKVIDGDTIKVSIGGRVENIRLIGVDTPEVDSRRLVEFFGKEASAFTRRLSLDKDVRLEKDPQGDTRDTYGRLLRYVYLPDGTLLNAEIIRQGYGSDALSPWGHFTNDGHIEVGIHGHRECAWYRRGSHDQLMWPAVTLHALFHQAQALMHTKAMLFINDHQTQFCVFQTFLKQGMSAHDDLRLACCNCCIGLSSLGTFQCAG